MPGPSTSEPAQPGRHRADRRWTLTEMWQRFKPLATTKWKQLRDKSKSVQPLHRRTVATLAIAVAGAVFVSGIAFAVSPNNTPATLQQVACAPGEALILLPNHTWQCTQMSGATPTSPSPTVTPTTPAPTTPAPTTPAPTTPAPTTPAPTTTTTTVLPSPTTPAPTTPAPTTPAPTTPAPTTPAPTTPAPTTPTPTPTGTGLLTNCFTRLAQCGYPHLGNVGVPAGTTLTPYTGPRDITQAGTVIDGKTINGCIYIHAQGVVIRNSVISGSECWVVHVQSGGSVTVEDSKVDCLNNVGTGFASSNFTARRVHITRCQNGANISGSNVTIVDSYIDKIAEVNGGHGDGVQMTNGTNILIRHNTFDIHNPITSSLIMGHNATNMTIENNFFAAGAYTVYCTDANTNVKYLNNRFYGPFGNWQSDTHRPAFGFRTNCNDPGITWTGNYRDDTLAAISA